MTQTLLIIDDIPENIEVLAGHLSDDYQVKCALSGPDGLLLAEEAPRPDLVLLDAMMPGMDGYQVCARLKLNPETRGIPIIFVTAKTDAESESLALAAAAVDFVHKPVNRDVVRARVRMHLDLKTRERELQQANAQLTDLNLKLNSANTSLNDLNIHLEQRVEERTQALQDAMLLAEAAHKAKHLFLANVNHELRTPMNAVVGLSELLARQIPDPALRGRADKIASASRQFLDVVDSIIDVADLQAGKIRLDFADFDLPALLDTLLEAWRGNAEDKGLTLQREFEAGLPRFLRGDSQRVGQILNNLLSNAVKFSERSHIVLRAQAVETRGNDLTVRFEVEDHGIGIELERQQAIFDIFEQADNSSTRRHGGIGIGLAICKQLTEIMGGRIGVESIPGLGSIFWATLPLTLGVSPSMPELLADAPSPDIERARQVVLDLTHHLSEGNEILAYITWYGECEWLKTVLGAQADAFSQAMENFDSAAALEHLRAIHFS